MKRIIFFGLLVFGLAASAQDKPSYFIGLPGQTAHARGNLRVDSVFLNALKDTTFTPWRLGLQVFRVADSSLYISTSLVAASKWTKLGAAGAGGVWGAITGTITSQTDLMTLFNGKQDTITLGTTSQYIDGTLALRNFSSEVTALTDPLYSNIAHSHSGLAPIGGTTGQILMKNSNTSYDYSWQDPSAGSGTVTNIATGLWLGGGPITTTGTIQADSAAMTTYLLRRKDSATLTNPVGYVTPTWLNNALAASAYTDADARAAISLTTTGTSGAATYNSGTGVLNIPQYSGAQNLSWDATNHEVDISGGGTSAVIPFATGSVNGLVSTTTQSFSGLKTYNTGIQSYSYVKALDPNGLTAVTLETEVSGPNYGGSLVLSSLNGNANNLLSAITLGANRTNRLPNISGTLANSVTVNGTNYVSDAAGIIDIGTISGGSGVTSVATNNGTGITGGTITTTGTLAIDTANTITTRLRLQHVIDSLAAISGLNENISNANLIADGDHTHDFTGHYQYNDSLSGLRYKSASNGTRYTQLDDLKPFYKGYSWYTYYNPEQYAGGYIQNLNNASDVVWETKDSTLYTRISLRNDSITFDADKYVFKEVPNKTLSATDSLAGIDINGRVWKIPSGTFSTASHVHAGADITSGTIATARLGSGTANSTKVLAGDNTWKSAVTVDLTGGANGYEVYVEDVSTGALATRAATGGTVTPTGWLKFQTGVTTNAPVNGDNLLQNDSLIGKRIEVYREGLLQDSSSSDGYTFNSGSGEITFVPALSTNQRVKIHVYSTASIYDITLEAPPPPGWNNFDFTIKDAGLTESPADVWNGTGSWGNKGLANIKLPASTDGEIRMRYATGMEDAVLGFYTSYLRVAYTSISAGIYINAGTIYRVDGGSAATTSTSISVNDYLKIYRSGSTLKAAKSPDGTTWTDVYTFSFSSSAVLFVVCDVNDQLNDPEQVDLIAASGDNYASGTTAITFPTSTNQTNTSGVITVTTPNGSYGNTGLSGLTLPSSTDGWIGFKYSALDAESAVLGFNTTNSEQGYANFEAGILISGVDIYKIDGGTVTDTGVDIIIGDWLRISRTGSTVKIQRSQDATSWTDVTTLSFSSTATLYIGSDLYGTGGKIYYPQGVSITP